MFHSVVFSKRFTAAIPNLNQSIKGFTTMDSASFLQICAANPDLFLRLLPETNNIKDIAKLCLVNKVFRDFLFSTIAGRQAWLKTASLVTGYEGSKIIDIRVEDFQYQLKLLVCPWLSEMTPMLFDFPKTSDPNIKEISVINNSRLLIRILEDSDFGDSSNELPLVFSLPAKPCRSQEELKRAVIKLPQNVENLNRYVITDQQENDWDEEKIIPSYSDVTFHSYKYLNENTVAVIESVAYDECFGSHKGGVYILSTREDVDHPVLLRHFYIQSMGNHGECDICTAPQRLWLTTPNCILYCGPQAEKTTLICDKEDGRVGRMAPAFGMAYKGDTQGLMKYMKEVLHGLDLNTRGLMEGRGVLYYAALGERPETVKFLIAAKCNVNQADDDDITPLMVAASNVDGESVRLLCNAGADVNWHSIDATPAILYTAVTVPKAGKSDYEAAGILETMISFGADVNFMDSDQKTVLFNAGIVNNTEAIRTLVLSGANQHHRDRDGNTLLHVYLSTRNFAVVSKCIELLNLMVNTIGIDVNTQNNMGETPLQMNIDWLTQPLVKYMIEGLKADVAIENNEGLTVYDKYLKVNSYRINDGFFKENHDFLKLIKG
jgi:ankyrin repeat protein